MASQPPVLPRSAEAWSRLEPTSLAAERMGATRESTVSIRVVSGLIEAVEQSGIARSQLLRAAQLAPEQLEASEARIPRSKVYRLCEVAMDLTNDPGLGLHWAERLSEGTFVPISHLIAHSASLRQGFASLAEFYRLLSDHASYQLVERDGKVTVYVDRLLGESLRVQRFTAEMMVVGFFRLIRNFRMHARPDCVSFAYREPDYHAEYARVFEQAVHFQQPFTGIVFDSALFDAPAPHKDEDVHEVLQALAKRRLLRITQRTPYAERVREHLVQHGSEPGQDMESVAHALGLSVRSLRRRLAAEGQSYADLVNEALAIVAKHMLRDKQRTIQETAFEMGFADTSSFHRAFKRWTGTTPGAYQEAQGERDELA
jgi:AraC-like DNA-binding protein